MIKRLTEKAVRSAGPGKHYDGHGLHLHVRKTASRQWVQRITVGGRRLDLGLGGWPVVTLAEARIQALENLRAVRLGGDPQPKRESAIPTFTEATEAVIALHRPGWRGGKSEHQWRTSLETYAGPLADMRVNEIEPAHVLEILTPHWHSKAVTMGRVRQRIGAVMAWAIAQGHRKDDPVAAIAAALPKPSNGAKAHHAALPPGKVADAVARIRASAAGPAIKLGLEFLVLTATRSGEVRGARWEEIDLEALVWTVPAARMKRSRDHRVPLSVRALAILEDARALSNYSGLIFPPARRAKMMSAGTFSDLLTELNVGCVPHGFRASFRDFCSELTDVPREVAEAALAHTVSDATERAYRRTDLFERRRALMADWAAFVRLDNR